MTFTKTCGLETCFQFCWCQSTIFQKFPEAKWSDCSVPINPMPWKCIETLPQVFQRLIAENLINNYTPVRSLSLSKPAFCLNKKQTVGSSQFSLLSKILSYHVSKYNWTQIYYAFLLHLQAKNYTQNSFNHILSLNPTTDKAFCWHKTGLYSISAGPKLPHTVWIFQTWRLLFTRKIE